MTVSAVKYPQVDAPKTDLDRLKEQKPHTLDEEKKRLKMATKEFESFFTYQLMKTMRKTIPKESFGQGGVFSGGMGKDIFTDMFDMQIAKDMVTDSDNSISTILYNSLEKLIEAPYKSGEEKMDIKPLHPDRNKMTPLKHESTKEIQKPKKHLPIENRPGDFHPIGNVMIKRQNVKNDEILTRYGKHIDAASKKYSLDPSLIISVIKAESNGDPNAVSAAGAKGLMQLVDSTAQDLKVRNVFDPAENIDAGSRYLKGLLDRFGSVKLALAAYNAGPTNVMRYEGIPPFAETEAYVEKVVDSLNTINGSKP